METTCFRDQDFLCAQMLTPENAMAYFSRSPFYERAMNTVEIALQQGLDPSQHRHQVGIEYALVPEPNAVAAGAPGAPGASDAPDAPDAPGAPPPPPRVFAVQKVQRTSETHVSPLAMYYIVDGTVWVAGGGVSFSFLFFSRSTLCSISNPPSQINKIKITPHHTPHSYQAPDLASVARARLARLTASLRRPLRRLPFLFEPSTIGAGRLRGAWRGAPLGRAAKDIAAETGCDVGTARAIAAAAAEGVAAVTGRAALAAAAGCVGSRDDFRLRISFFSQTKTPKTKLTQLNKTLTKNKTKQNKNKNK
jgi:hypothetical protein